MQLRLPQVLVNFACRKGFVSQSLRPSSWGNILGLDDLEDPAGTYDDESVSDVTEDNPDPPAWLEELRDRIRDNLPIESPLQAESHGELPGLIQSWLATCWWRLRIRPQYWAKHDKAIYPSTRRSTFLSVRWHSIFELEIDALELVYESALDAQATDSNGAPCQGSPGVSHVSAASLQLPDNQPLLNPRHRQRCDQGRCSHYQRGAVPIGYAGARHMRA